MTPATRLLLDRAARRRALRRMKATHGYQAPAPTAAKLKPPEGPRS